MSVELNKIMEDEVTESHITIIPDILDINAEVEEDKESTELKEKPGTSKSEFEPTSKQKRELRYDCPQCDKRFTTKFTLAKHLKWHNKEIPTPHKCCHCGEEFAFPRQLKLHLREKHTDAFIGKWKCERCRRVFYSREEYEEHLQSHAAVDVKNPYHCSWCDKTFLHQHTLNQHVARSHRGERPHQCTHCEESFMRKQQLRSHLFSRHGEVIEDYKCSYCEKCFTTRISLVEHTRIHTNEKPHSCPVCLKQFARKSSLRSHLRTHQTQWDEKQVDCSVCGKTMGSSSLRKHMQIHEETPPYQCGVCGRGFAREDNMLRHEERHQKEKKFYCDKCDKYFYHKKSLEPHLKAFHSSDKN